MARVYQNIFYVNKFLRQQLQGKPMIIAIADVIKQVLLLEQEPDENKCLQTQRQINNDLAQLYLAQGFKYTIKRMLGTAIEFYEISLYLNPQLSILHDRLEQLYYIFGLNPQQRDISSEDRQKQLIFNAKMARLCLSYKQKKEAKWFINQTIKLYPNHQQFLLLGLCQENVENSIQQYQQFIKKFPTNFYAYFLLGFSYAKIKDYHQAKRCFQQAININPQFSQALQKLGYLNDLLGQTQQAIQSYRLAASINPKSPDLMFSMGKHYCENENLSLGFECLKRALEYSLQKPIYQSSRFYQNLGSILLQYKNLNLAKDCFARIIEISPQNSFGYNGMGAICQMKKQYSQAQIYFEKAISLNPKKGIYYHNLAISYYQSGKNSFKCIQNFYNAIKYNPSHQDSYNGLIKIYFQNQNYQMIIQCCHQIIRMNSNQRQDYYQMLSHVIIIYISQKKDVMLTQLITQSISYLKQGIHLGFLPFKETHQKIVSIYKDCNQYSLAITHIKAIQHAQIQKLQDYLQIAYPLLAKITIKQLMEILKLYLSKLSIRMHVQENLNCFIRIIIAFFVDKQFQALLQMLERGHMTNRLTAAVAISCCLQNQLVQDQQADLAFYSQVKTMMNQRDTSADYLFAMSMVFNQTKYQDFSNELLHRIGDLTDYRRDQSRIVSIIESCQCFLIALATSQEVFGDLDSRQYLTVRRLLMQRQNSLSLINENRDIGILQFTKLINKDKFSSLLVKNSKYIDNLSKIMVSASKRFLLKISNPIHRYLHTHNTLNKRVEYKQTWIKLSSYNKVNGRSCLKQQWRGGGSVFDSFGMRQSHELFAFILLEKDLKAKQILKLKGLMPQNYMNDFIRSTQQFRYEEQYRYFSSMGYLLQAKFYMIKVDILSKVYSCTTNLCQDSHRYDYFANLLRELSQIHHFEELLAILKQTEQLQSSYTNQKSRAHQIIQPQYTAQTYFQPREYKLSSYTSDIKSLPRLIPRQKERDKLPKEQLFIQKIILIRDILIFDQIFREEFSGFINQLIGPLQTDPETNQTKQQLLVQKGQKGSQYSQQSNISNSRSDGQPLNSQSFSKLSHFYDKSDHYYKLTRTLQRSVLFRQTIIQSEYKNHPQQLKSLYFHNHVNVIRYLSDNKHNLKFIARHHREKNYIEQDIMKNVQFTFYVDRGHNQFLPQNQNSQMYISLLLKGGTRRLFTWVYSFISGIQELQSLGLFNGDLCLRNSILIIQNQSQYFKIIDFDRAIKIFGQNCQGSQNAQKDTLEMIKSLLAKDSNLLGNLYQYLFPNHKKDGVWYQNIRDIASKQISSNEVKALKVMQCLTEFMYVSHRHQLIAILNEMKELIQGKQPKMENVIIDLEQAQLQNTLNVLSSTIFLVQQVEDKALQDRYKDVLKHLDQYLHQ